MGPGMLSQKSWEKMVQKVAKTYSKTDVLKKADIFVKKWAKTSSETGILKSDFLAN